MPLKSIDKIINRSNTISLEQKNALRAAFKGHYEDYGWRDITGAIDTRGVGPTDPAWTIVGSGPFYDYSFALNDEAWFNFHIPHDIASNVIHIHTHWYPSGTNVQPVKWQYTYTLAKGFNQEAFSSTGTVVTAEEAGPGIALQHMVTETAAITLPNLTEPDGLLKVHVKRVVNGGTDNTDTIYVAEVDVHYISDNMATPGKAPDFNVSA